MRGWSKDKRGVSWQLTLRALKTAMASPNRDAKRAMGAMMTMRHIDIAAINVAAAGERA